MKTIYYRLVFIYLSTVNYIQIISVYKFVRNSLQYIYDRPIERGNNLFKTSAINLKSVLC